MKTYWKIERFGEYEFVCKNCGHHQDFPYDECPECGFKEADNEQRFNKP